MPHDQLFLLRADFADPALGPGAYHCTDCARIEGLLSYFPQLRTQLDVTYVDLPRPRAPIVELLGPEYQNCPVLSKTNVQASRYWILAACVAAFRNIDSAPGFAITRCGRDAIMPGINAFIFAGPT